MCGGVARNGQDLERVPQHLERVPALQDLAGLGHALVLWAMHQGTGVLHQFGNATHVIFVVMSHYNVLEFKAQTIQGLQHRSRLTWVDHHGRLVIVPKPKVIVRQCWQCE